MDSTYLDIDLAVDPFDPLSKMGKKKWTDTVDLSHFIESSSLIAYNQTDMQSIYNANP